MLTIANLINRSLTFAFDLFYLPLSVLGPMGSLAVFSAVTGVLMLWVYKHVSNQEAIRRHKSQVMGNLIGVRLFQDDLGVFFQLQRRILGATLRYASHSLKPLAVVLVPIVLILIQLDWRYGARPFEPGEAALLKVTVADAAALPAVSLEGVEGVVVETPAIRIPSQREVVWRIRAAHVGAHDLVVKVGDMALTKRVVVGETTDVIPVTRTSEFLKAMLYPGETPIADGPVRSITVLHPAADVDVFGWRMHWLIPFFGLSVLTGFALKGVFGVDL